MSPINKYKQVENSPECSILLLEFEKFSGGDTPAPPLVAQACRRALGRPVEKLEYLDFNSTLSKN